MSIKDVSCPECDLGLKLRHHLHQGQQLTCPACESKLVVVSLKPVELEAAPLANHSARSMKKPNIVEVPCPECDNFIKTNAHARKGHRILCSDCNTMLEVVNTNPIEFDIALTVNLKRQHRFELEAHKRIGKKNHKDRG